MKRTRIELSEWGKLRQAVQSAFWTGMTTTAALMAPSVVSAQETQPAAATPETTELETIEVTGSRLKRTSLETALPVTVIDRKHIDLSGEISVAELLRNTSLNTFGSFRNQSGSSAQGLAAIDLRGLGSERTLVLIDGKRAPKAPFAPTAQDLNAVPLAAVERIEILQDGASAVYGSDAIAGVVNIILRKDFQGTQMMYGGGRPSVEGGDTEQGGFIMGIPMASGNAVFGVSYNTRDIMFSKDQVANGIGVRGASAYGNNYKAYTAASDINNRTAVDPDGAGPFNPNRLTNVPGGCASSPAFILTPVSPTVPGGPPHTGFTCRYDFTAVAANEASSENMALFAKGRYELSSDWEVYSTASISRSQSFGRYAPAPAGAYIESPFSGIDHNSDGAADDIYLYHRFDALGTRDDDVDGSVYDVLGGFKGNLGPFGVDFGARYNEYKTYILGQNYVVLPIALQFIADGSYNFLNPAANTAAVLNQMKATINRESTWETKEVWGTANMDLFKLAGGMAGLAFGGEVTSAQYFDQYDSLSEGGVIGGSAGNSSGKNRIVRGFFVEAGLPILDNLEATVAARYDDYSDASIDGQLSPKLSVGFQPLDILKLRAAYGTGFRAPTLDVISLLPSFSAEPMTNDPATCADIGGVFANGSCDTATQVNATVIANPALSPEESDQYSLGFVVDPLDNVNVSLDYYSYKIDGLISYFSPADLVDLEAAGAPIPPGLSLTRDPLSGAITDSVVGYSNRGFLKTSGLNLDANVNFDLGAMGRVTSNLQAGYVMTYDYDDTDDQVGLPGFPEMRSNLFNTYTFRSYSAAWNLNHIGDTARTAGGAGHVGSYITHDVQFNYEHPWNGMVSVGAQNVLDKRIPVYSYDGRPYNFYLYEAYGAVPYIRYTQRF